MKILREINLEENVNVKHRSEQLFKMESCLDSNEPLVNCIFNYQNTDQKMLLSKRFWDMSDEVEIAKECKEGNDVSFRSVVRTRWDSDNLYFYAEIQGDLNLNDNEQVWNGSNLEILISPSGASIPYVDEYEFLFNSDGASNSLHWDNGSDLETSLRWEANGLQYWVIDKPLFVQDMVGYAIVIKMPFAMFNEEYPESDACWRLGLYRKIDDGVKVELLAWSPTLTDPVKFHVPTKFGYLRFIKDNSYFDSKAGN